jgi:hypothetical protein
VACSVKHREHNQLKELLCLEQLKDSRILTPFNLLQSQRLGLNRLNQQVEVVYSGSKQLNLHHQVV